MSLHSDDIDDVHFVLDQHVIVLVHWNNNLWADMSLHSDTLSWSQTSLCS